METKPQHIKCLCATQKLTKKNHQNYAKHSNNRQDIYRLQQRIAVSVQ